MDNPRVISRFETIMGKKTKNLQDTELSPKLKRHLGQLAIADVQAYQTWCSVHGFGAGLNKPKKMLARECEYRRKLAIKREQTRDRAGRIPLRKCLVDIAAGKHISASSGKTCVQAFSTLAKTVLHPGREGDRQTLVLLIEHLLATRAKFVDDSHCDASICDGGISILESLVLVAADRNHWIRPLEDWKPRTRNAVRQLRSLLRHLFDQYGEVPIFMDRAWAVARATGGSIDANALKYRQWYAQIGAGKGVREIDFPIAMSKRMGAQFLKAPKDVSIAQAIRWGQVVGLGGDARLAEAILATRLGESFRHDDFWISVIRWLIDQPMLDHVHVGPIVDYLHHQRFVPGHGFGVLEELDPPEPNLTMRGRTATSLLRQVDRWHGRLAGTNRVQVQNWQSCGIRGFELPEGRESSEKFRIWSIRELLGTKSLVLEGRKLGHCVATYSQSCVRGATSIWTLELESYAGIEKRITLEVHPATRTIVQARGKHNRKMKEQEASIVRRWCAVAGLSIARWVL